MKDEMKYTTIRITIKNKERLKQFGKVGDMYDDMLGKALTLAEMERTLQLPGEAPPQ